MPSEELEPLSAVLIINNAKRLVQNPTSTYLLVGILSFVGKVHIFKLFSSALRRFTKWRKGLLDMDVKGLAPDGFSSIAMMAALLDASTFAKYVPEDSYKLSKKDLYDRLSSMRFRMGWFRRESDRSLHFTNGVMDDDDFTFVGSKEDVGSKDLANEDVGRQDIDRQEIDSQKIDKQDVESQDVESPDVDNQDLGSEDALEGEERSEIEGTSRPVSPA